ncbi:tetratricopeptide repeat protein [Corallococcus macrosporus]|uniref:Tetratricopeptide repeat protein n=1 Tax=Corallococcus macrosporus TaxID=35 RepID=A0ABS3D5X3_9BACT|nr:tetratricopeptide repeat protein [Corallococcus macrosporus]MBN8227054.1 tetratricopeptide repeat protein [Corallococcus macrosporus]
MSPKTRTRSRPNASFRRFTVPPALRKALVPAALAALGLAAWEDVPLPRLLKPWLAHAVEARTGQAPVAAAPTLPLEASGHEPVSAPRLLDETAPVEAPAGVPSDALSLPHTHARRVDHVARAQGLRELGDLSGAVTELRRALHDDPGATDALAWLARTARLAGDTKLAIDAYGRLGQAEPHDAGALVQQARLLVSEGRFPEAVHVGEEALLRDPEDPEVYQVLGRAHLGANELSSAILRFQQAVHLDPEHGHALNNLGFAYLRANDNARAVEVLTQAAGLLPHVAYVQNNLGVACERLGRLEEARAAYAAATRLSPRYVQARVNAERVGRVARADPAAPVLPEALPPVTP